MSVQVLIDGVAAIADLPKAKARLAVDAMIAEISEGLAAGNDVRIAGLGTFSLRERAVTAGRNPRTGEPIQIAARRKVRFKPAKALRERLNPAPAAARQRA
jgi:DNA-binding protein HU-beta